MQKPRVATLWLDGCSGCHMSLLDLDERLIDLARQIELVYSPIVDHKQFPDHADLTLVEGAVGNEEDIVKLKIARERSHLLVALGDCAVTGNVPAMRNNVPLDALLARGYIENATDCSEVPQYEVPRLCAKVRPLNEVVPIDLFIPGCPPPADLIHLVLTQCVAGHAPDISTMVHFGN